MVADEWNSGVSVLDFYEARAIFEWPKPIHCWFEEGHGGKRLIKVRHWRRLAVRPLVDPEFSLSFARLAAKGEPSEANIKKWVLKYGLPTWENDDTWGRGPTKDSLLVNDFTRQVALVHMLLHFYTEIDREDLVAIKARTTNPQSYHERDLARRLEKAFDSREYREHKLAFVSTYRWNKTELDLFMSRRALADVLSDLVPDLRPRLVAASPRAMEESYDCPDLLMALYLQLYLLILQGHPMRYCKRDDCRTPFPRKGKKRFCNASCRSAARSQR